MISVVSLGKPANANWIIGASVAICLLSLCYMDRLNWYYEFSKSEHDYAETAIADCRFHIRLFPNDGKLHGKLAYYLNKDAVVTFDEPRRQALLREAIDEYENSIESNPGNAQTYFELAQLYEYRLGDYHTADTYYQKAATLCPDDSVYQSWLVNNQENIARTSKSDCSTKR